MDIARLEKLARLAGLHIEEKEKEALLEDIRVLEALAAGLPAVDEEVPPLADLPEQPRSAAESGPVPWNLQLMRRVAPSLEDGFFLIPGVRPEGRDDD